MTVDESAERQSWLENGIKTRPAKINLETFPGPSRKFNVETLIYVSS